mmetsp:Transcript_10197/g.30401  ORF Transcript_10197/g.30401 Transcript_10197/m.30401 type:complete len:377 (-) Transcript_10197:2155-3285(-)|eukprot:CAMPEP_0118867306 /NCGR_PEP_ID=MMETSP1163-20130328/10952_1 /TAXON_ID=124430 /ORGANISM="Phaeomonas parva, Strain CCMP2877" /LENGTH=376 /DNA_ID=CAMNT_0006801707 /DNA_START=155 /DNA_END=1285 /DNA_ORIENTATION=+
MIFARALVLAALAGAASGFRVPPRAAPRSSALHMSTATPEASAMMDAAYTEISSQLSTAKEAMGISEEFMGILEGFMAEYLESNKEAGTDPAMFVSVLKTLMGSLSQQFVEPYKFSTFHEAIRDQPTDLYAWGNNFFRPLVVEEDSRLEGEEKLDEIMERLESGENVMFLSNHQTEADPQVISLLFEGRPETEKLAEKVICVAGHKVTTDPLAIPFSMGRNLLCIHSKKHINNPPELKDEKQKQNMETMTRLGELLAEGGKILWVAPSGGRDRADAETGEFVVAPFDPKSVLMFNILGMKSGKPLNFYPMAMYTNQLVPPPSDVAAKVGEARSAKRGAARVAIGDAVKAEDYATSREAFAEEVYSRVSSMYDGLKE